MSDQSQTESATKHQNPASKWQGNSIPFIAAGAVGLCCLGLDLLATTGFVAATGGLIKSSAPWLIAGLVIMAIVVIKKWGKRFFTHHKSTAKTLMPLLLAAIIASYGSYRPESANASFLSSGGLQLGEVAPDFKVPTLDGKTFTLAAQRGKPTIIFFMANWCGSCVPEGQALTRLHQEYGEKISIVALDIDPASTPEHLRRFKQAAGDGNYTWAFDRKQQVTARYKVRTLDTTLVLDQQGRIVYQDQWPSPYKALKQQLVKVGLK